MKRNKEKRLARKYILKGYGSSGSKEGRKHYRRAMRYAMRDEKYEHKSFEARRMQCDIEMSCYYDTVAREERKKSRKFMGQAAECGNDMAVMMRAFFFLEDVPPKNIWRLYDITEEKLKDITDELLALTKDALNLGFAPAAYMLSIIYRDGFCNIAQDLEKQEYYYSEYERLRVSDGRQRSLCRYLPVYYRNDDRMQQLNFHLWIMRLIKRV